MREVESDGQATGTVGCGSTATTGFNISVDLFMASSPRLVAESTKPQLEAHGTSGSCP